MQDVEEAIARVAGAQENVISRRQLLAAGLRRGAVDHRAKAGDLRLLHRAVYLLGAAPPTQRGRAWAAVLAVGEGAVVSHRTAAELWGILRAGGGRDPEVTVVGRNPRPRPGIIIHRSIDLPDWQIGDINGLPVTAVARVVCDLAGTESTNEVEHALQEARVHHHLTDAQLHAVISRTPTKQGAALLRRLLDAEDDRGYTRSEAERMMRSHCRRADLAQPLANRFIEGLLVDFVWTRQRLIVEVDGYRTHGDRGAFERDRRRDQILTAAGYRVIRITWRQLTQEPLAVIARLAQALVQIPLAA
jgi:very-short-patch-repair endonuclease